MLSLSYLYFLPKLNLRANRATTAYNLFSRSFIAFFLHPSVFLC